MRLPRTGSDARQAVRTFKRESLPFDFLQPFIAALWLVGSAAPHGSSAAARANQQKHMRAHQAEH